MLLLPNYFSLFLNNAINITGKNTRLVKVATNNVNEVSQPNANVPPK